MKNFKDGLYRLEKSSDIFDYGTDSWKIGESIEVRLTDKEVAVLFSNKLYERLGFVGWQWLED